MCPEVEVSNPRQLRDTLEENSGCLIYTSGNHLWEIPLETMAAVDEGLLLFGPVKDFIATLKFMVISTW